MEKIRILLLCPFLFFNCVSFAQVSEVNKEKSDTQLNAAYRAYQQGNDLEAERLAHLIINLPGTEVSKSKKALAHRFIANLCAAHSRKAEQIEHLYKSFWLFKEDADKAAEPEALRLIGSYYLQMQLTEKANDYFEQARHSALSQGDTISQINIIHNQAQLLIFEKKSNEARKLLEQGILLAQKRSYKKGLLENWNSLAYVYRLKKEPVKMLTCLKESLQNATDNTDTLGILYKDMALAYQDYKKIDSAEYYLKKGLTLIRLGNNQEQEMIICQLLSHLKKEQGETKEALIYLSRSNELQSDLFTSRLKEEIQYVEARNRDYADAFQQNEDEKKSKLVFIGFVSGVILLIASGITIFWLKRNNQFIANQKRKLRDAHDQLQRSEQLHRQLFDNSPGLIIVHTLDGIITSTNQAAEMLLKADKDRLIGRSVRDFLHPDYKRSFADFTKTTVEQNSNEGWMRVIDSEGDAKILRYHSTVVKPEQGDAYVMGFALDQTEVFQARLDTEHERKRLLSVMENSPDIFSILSAEGSIQYMNRSNFFDVKSLIGKNVLQFLPDDQAIRFYQNLQLVFTSKQPGNIEESFRGKHFQTKLIPILQNDKVIEVLTINTDITDSRLQLEKEKQLNKKVEQSEKQYRQLVEESKVLICKHDPSGKLLSINKPGAEMVGFTVDELVGANLGSILPNEFQNEYQYYLHQIANTGVFEGFLTVFTKEGKRIVLLYRNVLITEEGSAPYILATAQDVTEWKKAEQRERRIRQELELVVSSTDDFIMEFDDQERFKNIWCRDENKLFMPVSSFIGKTIKEAFQHAPEFAADATRLYNEVIATGEVHTIEIDDIFSAVPLYYMARLSPLREEDGRCVRCTVLVTNITKRKQAEIKLTEEQLLLRTIIDNLPLNIYVKNIERKKILANRSEFEYLGVSGQDDILGTQDQDVLGDVSEQESYKEDLQVLKGDHILGKEVMSVKKDGSQSWFLISKVPLRNSADQITGLVGISLDISNRKQIEIELLKAKEMAEESNRLKTIFLGSLSHEVRTPLQGIIGFAEILEAPGIPDQKRNQYLEYIKKRALDMQEIIDSLLDMASIETGEIKSFPVETNLYELIEESIFKNLQAEHGDKQIKLLLENNIQKDKVIQIDAVHVRQVIANLVKNGIKFTERGSVTIICHEFDKHFLISVVDTGIGIEQDKLEYIFEPFRQAHEGLSRSKGGIGLGLSICKKMVEMWGGSLHVESLVGKGSTFSFTIPIYRSDFHIS